MREGPRKKEKVGRRIGWALDSAISIVAPGIAFRRKTARLRSDFLDRARPRARGGGFRGADKDRLKSDWLPGSGSADEELLPDLASLRERSRDLNRNDPNARGATNTMVTNVIGTGMRPQSRLDAEDLGLDEEQAKLIQKRMERAWEVWMPWADAGERLHLLDMQRLIELQILESGEAILLRQMIKEPGRPYRLAYQVIEPDRLATPWDNRGDKRIRDGVTVGDRGQPLSYFIRKTHPGDSRYGRLSSNKGDEFLEVPVRNKFGHLNLIHRYWIERPGQTRGIPFFAPVLQIFTDLAGYAEAELVAARLAACIALMIESPDAAGQAFARGDGTDSNSNRLEELAPGIIEYLEGGQKIATFNPGRPNASFDPFVERCIRLMAAGLNLPYELVAKDFSKTNYSSARAALLEAHRFFTVRQEWFARSFCQPIWEDLIEGAWLKGEIPVEDFYQRRTEYVRATWIAPGWGWVDPLKEVKAEQSAIENNIRSLADVAAAHGRDWEDVVEQRSREKKKIDELGLAPEPKAPPQPPQAPPPAKEK